MIINHFLEWILFVKMFTLLLSQIDILVTLHRVWKGSIQQNVQK